MLNPSSACTRPLGPQAPRRGEQWRPICGSILAMLGAECDQKPRRKTEQFAFPFDITEAPLSQRGAFGPDPRGTPVERGVARMADNPSSGPNQAWVFYQLVQGEIGGAGGI